VKVQAVEFEGSERMSVIGRLDEQVDKVLISPRAGKNEQETNEQDNDSDASRAATRTASDSLKKRNAERDTLPVWLL
jgi:hypothetical protein